MTSRSSSNRGLSTCLLLCFLSICEPKSAPPARSSKTSNDVFAYSDAKPFPAERSKRSAQFGVQMDQAEQLREPLNHSGIQMDQTEQLHGPSNQFGIQMEQTEQLHEPSNQDAIQMNQTEQLRGPSDQSGIQMNQTEQLHGPSSSLHCSIESSARFDCYPEPGANSHRCAARGCCWHLRTVSEPTVSKKQRINIPYCFFPTNYNGYTLDQTRDTDTGFTARVLRPRSSRSGRPDDVFELKLEVIFETQTRLHFKVTLYDPLSINLLKGV